MVAERYTYVVEMERSVCVWCGGSVSGGAEVTLVGEALLMKCDEPGGAGADSATII